MNYFEILSVSEDATGEEVRAGYLAKIVHLHPDISADPEHHRQARLINEAYHHLRDPGLRHTHRVDLRRDRLQLEWRAQREAQPAQIVYGLPMVVHPRRDGLAMAALVLLLACVAVSGGMLLTMLPESRLAATMEPSPAIAGKPAKPACSAASAALMPCLAGLVSTSGANAPAAVPDDAHPAIGR